MNKKTKEGMRVLRREKGFTLIELIMVIVLLGLLAVVAIPQYTNLQSQAKTAAEKGVVGGVRSGIYTKYTANLANNVTPAYPATLGGSAGNCTTGNPCFGNVLAQGVTQDWVVGANATFTGPANTTYTYSSSNGTFQ